MSRPRSIVNFEVAYLLSIALGLVGTSLTWHSAMTQASANPAAQQFGPNFLPTIMIGGVAVVVVVEVLLWYLAARRAQVAAKWIITAFFVVGVGLKLTAMFTGRFVLDSAGTVSLAVTLVTAVAVYFLFRPDARVWFGEMR